MGIDVLGATAAITCSPTLTYPAGTLRSNSFWGLFQFTWKFHLEHYMFLNKILFPASLILE